MVISTERSIVSKCPSGISMGYLTMLVNNNKHCIFAETIYLCCSRLKWFITFSKTWLNYSLEFLIFIVICHDIDRPSQIRVFIYSVLAQFCVPKASVSTSINYQQVPMTLINRNSNVCDLLCRLCSHIMLLGIFCYHMLFTNWFYLDKTDSVGCNAFNISN